MGKRIFIFLIILFIFFAMAWMWWQQAISPVDKTSTTYTSFTITRGEDARTIAKNLQKEGLIRDPIAFFLYARFFGIGQKLQSGEFRLSPSQNLATIATSLTHGTSDVWVTIVEGWRNEEIALKLAQDFSIPETEFLKIARIGYMFPDTYLVPKDASASTVASLFFDNFNKKVTPNLISKAKEKGLSTDDLITVASLVEREARLNEDRPIVASVILNRLKIGMKLDIDATVQYILGYQPNEKSWWKKNLTLEDLAISSPYNTYKNAGLPPEPICNPGIAVITAVVNAPQTDYIYYVSDKSGKIHPAKTLEEHNQNVTKYVQ